MTTMGALLSALWAIRRLAFGLTYFDVKGRSGVSLTAQLRRLLAIQRTAAMLKRGTMGE